VSAELDRDRGGLGGQPRGLTTLFLTEFWERFSYYGMRAILVLFMVAPIADGGLGLDTEQAARIYGLYTGSVYLATIPGGFIADRLLGLRRAVLVGGILIALGHYTLAVQGVETLFFMGLVLIVLGTGLLKANISAIVGKLYAPDDERRDAGFSIFYMGINLGAFVSPFVCGYLGQRIGWHWGFGAAGVGMTLGLVQYLWGQKRLGTAGVFERPAKDPGKNWSLVLAAVAIIGGALIAAGPYRDLLIAGSAVALFAWLLWKGAENIGERKKIGALALLFIFASLFWMGFEQAGSSLTLFAERLTENRFLSFSFPSSWYQSVEPFFVIAFAPVFAWIWLRLGSRAPSTPAKFAVALFLLSASFFLIAFASGLFEAQQVKVNPFWLIAVYFLHALGELSLSPIGLSAVTKLAPARIMGFLMGTWFLTNAVGNFTAGSVASYFDRLPLPQLFGAVGLVSLIAAAILVVLAKPIRELMSGVH
jgi:POT family proton-dependent oligopeptide transporter